MNPKINYFLTILMVFTIAKVNGNIQPKFTNTNHSTKRDSANQTIQVSFVPYFGTNGFQSDSVYTDISINILAGVVYGVRSCEIGGLLNIVRSNVSNCQIAGMGNVVMGKISGFQGAGTFNFSKSLDGIQIAGITNSTGTAIGMQIAGINNHATRGNCDQISGIANSSLDTTGFQISGLANYAPYASMFQIGGLVNVSRHTPFQIAGLVNQSKQSEQFQIAGLVNNTGNVTQLQISGLVNNSPEIKNLQLAGLVNNSPKVEGAQIAGILNRTSYFKGVQVGLINISDSCDGIPIGFLNIVRNGYFNLELSGDEIFYTNLAFRSGLTKLHSIITAGIKPNNLTEPLWNYGAGMGSLLNLSAKTRLGLDATFHHIIKGGNTDNNFLLKLGAGIDLKLATKLSIYAGITYNFLYTDKENREYGSVFSTLAPYYFTETENNHHNLKTWLGFKFGVRIL